MTVLHKHEMKCSLLVPPAFEKPNLIELNYFPPSFHVEPHIYIRGKKLIFRASLYCFPINLQRVCCDRQFSIFTGDGGREISDYLYSVLLCVRAVGCAHLMCAFVCQCIPYDSHVSKLPN